MSKKTRCRVLSLLLALVMVLGMVPMASASSAYNVKLTPTTPDASKLSTAIQQNKFKLQNGEEATRTAIPSARSLFLRARALSPQR